jgi:hypothetical protein
VGNSAVTRMEGCKSLLHPNTIMGYKDKEKQRAYQREWMARRRQEWFDENGPCVWCGSEDDLEIDHIDPMIKENNSVWSWSEERRKAELAKCRVLCHDCHEARHAKLSRQDVITIRQEYRPGVKGNGFKALAKKYGVTHNAIKRAIRRTSWKNIP